MVRYQLIDSPLKEFFLTSIAILKYKKVKEKRIHSVTHPKFNLTLKQALLSILSRNRPLNAEQLRHIRLSHMD